jgi:hypothetical protein
VSGRERSAGRSARVHPEQNSAFRAHRSIPHLSDGDLTVYSPMKVMGSKPEVGRRAEAENGRVGSLVLAVGRPGAITTASFGIISTLPYFHFQTKRKAALS